jgi:hypothetical protein
MAPNQPRILQEDHSRMSTHGPRRLDIPVELLFDRTVSRSCLNRSAISEVFLTDLHVLDESRSVGAAQLPKYHAYYTDHTVRPEAYDLLLLLEVSRQVAIYNELLRNDESTRMARLANDLEINLTQPEAALLGTGPGEITAHVTASRVHLGEKWQVTTLVDMFIDGHYVGWTRIKGTYIRPATLRALRQRQRGGTPFLSTDLPQIPAGVPVPPAQVGRSNPANVVLSNATSDGPIITARLALQPRNTSILEHEYDHVPAMAMAEAARQMGLIALEKTGAVDSTCQQRRATGLHATFGRFAELDSPVTMTACRTDAPNAADDDGTVGVEFKQRGQDICHLTIRFARSAP